MKVKVIKEINGLEIGDVLEYNEKTHKYELSKLEEDISDNGYSSKKTLHTYSKNVIQDNLEYFQFIDKNGDNVYLKDESKLTDTINELDNKSTETIEDWKSECIKLHNQIKDLEQQLDLYTNRRYRYMPSYTYRLIDFL